MTPLSVHMTTQVLVCLLVHCRPIDHSSNACCK